MRSKGALLAHLGRRGAPLNLAPPRNGAKVCGPRLGASRMTSHVPAQRQGEISLQRVPRQTPCFECIVHESRLHGQAAWPTGSATAVARACSHNLGQSIRRNWPFKSSTSEVQLSTQSPSLQYRMPLMSRISARWMWPQTTVSTPRFRAAWATASSKLPIYWTAVFALFFKSEASD